MNTIIAVWLFISIAFSSFRVFSYSLTSSLSINLYVWLNLTCLWNLHSAYSKWCLHIVAAAAELIMAFLSFHYLSFSFLSFPSSVSCEVGDAELLSCSVLPQHISYWTKQQFNHNNQGFTHAHQECNSYAVLFIGRYNPAAWTSSDQLPNSISLISCHFSSDFPAYTLWVFLPYLCKLHFPWVLSIVIYHPNNSWWRMQILSNHVLSFMCYFLSLKTKYSPHQPFQTHSPYALP